MLRHRINKHGLKLTKQQNAPPTLTIPPLPPRHEVLPPLPQEMTPPPSPPSPPPQAK